MNDLRSGPSVAVSAMSWPARLFVGWFLLDMLARSLISLSPYDDQWAPELAMSLAPLPLPSAEEFDQIAVGKHPDGYQTASERVGACAASAGRFLIPCQSRRRATGCAPPRTPRNGASPGWERG
jgi:hypothetical protein